MRFDTFCLLRDLVITKKASLVLCEKIMISRSSIVRVSLINQRCKHLLACKMYVHIVHLECIITLMGHAACP